MNELAFNELLNNNTADDSEDRNIKTSVDLSKNSELFETKIMKSIEHETERSNNIYSCLDVSNLKEQDVSGENIKAWNRETSKLITDDEKKKLVRQRNTLVEKKFSSGLTQREERKLKFVRWQLDRIDDAEMGEHFEKLDFFAKQYQEFSEEINTILSHFKESRKRH